MVCDFEYFVMNDKYYLVVVNYVKGIFYILYYYFF